MFSVIAAHDLPVNLHCHWPDRILPRFSHKQQMIPRSNFCNSNVRDFKLRCNLIAQLAGKIYFDNNFFIVEKIKRSKLLLKFMDRKIVDKQIDKPIFSEKR